jgi:arginase
MVASMPTIAALIVPYELGRLREGVGCGPEHLLDHGAEDALRSSGAVVHTRLIELDDRFNVSGSGEEDAAFELIRLVADGVRGARKEGAFPVVLSGSCFSAVGAVAGLDEAAPGVVWFDAHADFNEPATTISGYLDGMGVAILTGSAWQAMLATVPGASPLPESRVLLAGARDLDPPEEVRLAASQIVHLTADQLRTPDALVEAVNGITPGITGLYVHLDLDVLDASVATVNVYHSPNGPDVDHIDALVAALLETFPVRAISVGTYDPAFDPEDHVPPIALRILRTIAASL